MFRISPSHLRSHGGIYLCEKEGQIGRLGKRPPGRGEKRKSHGDAALARRTDSWRFACAEKLLQFCRCYWSSIRIVRYGNVRPIRRLDRGREKGIELVLLSDGKLRLEYCRQIQRFQRCRGSKPRLDHIKKDSFIVVGALSVRHSVQASKARWPSVIFLLRTLSCQFHPFLELGNLETMFLTLHGYQCRHTTQGVDGIEQYTRNFLRRRRRQRCRRQYQGSNLAYISLAYFVPLTRHGVHFFLLQRDFPKDRRVNFAVRSNASLAIIARGGIHDDDVLSLVRLVVQTRGPTEG
mmetsp:Transcript_14880/g.31529  ORF Transcript_14880/g.31529 Transcript_14880/m.31529 type:complete len:293 (-) Transcript_14880:953-1831(-)